MSTYTILLVSDDPASAIAQGLKGKAHQLLATGSLSQAMAYLFVNRRIDAAVIDQRSQPAALNTAHLLRTVRADVPILLLSPETIAPLPSCVDACLSGENLLDTVVLTLDLLLAKPADLTAATQIAGHTRPLTA